MEYPKKHIVIVAGEASGDLHASHLVRAIQQLNPNITFSGLGGPQMASAGVKLYHDLTKIAVIGFGEVIRHYPTFRRAFYDVLDQIRLTHADTVILVDYPGFNLRLAQKISRQKTKIIYYISPQLWAWKEKRVNIIKHCVDKMIVLFAFEREFYKRFGIDAAFVGHPLLDEIETHTTKQAFLKKIGLDDYKLTVGLLPGSRVKEIEHILPAMLSACQILKKEFPMLQFMLVKAPSIQRELIDEYLKNASAPITITNENSSESIHACDVCMVASGTATLETAILGKPMVVIYKTSLLTWMLAKMFIKIPYIGLVNVVAGKKIVPECIQFDATGEKIAEEIKTIFTNETRIGAIKMELERVKIALGEPGSLDRAAREVLSTLNS